MAVRSVEREMNGGTAIKEADKLNLIDISDFVTKSKVVYYIKKAYISIYFTEKQLKNCKNNHNILPLCI